MRNPEIKGIPPIFSVTVGLKGFAALYGRKLGSNTAKTTPK